MIVIDLIVYFWQLIRIQISACYIIVKLDELENETENFPTYLRWKFFEFTILSNFIS